MQATIIIIATLATTTTTTARSKCNVHKHVVNAYAWGIHSCFYVRVSAAKMIYYPLNYEPFIQSPRSPPFLILSRNWFAMVFIRMRTIGRTFRPTQFQPFPFRVCIFLTCAPSTRTRTISLLFRTLAAGIHGAVVCKLFRVMR